MLDNNVDNENNSNLTENEDAATSAQDVSKEANSEESADISDDLEESWMKAPENGTDVTDKTLDRYEQEADEEEAEAIRREWKEKEALQKKKLNPLSTVLMIGVLFFVPWYIWNSFQDIQYFFSSSEPIDLGNAAEYRLAGEGEVAKPQAFEDNRYVKVTGIPIRHVGIQTKDNPIEGRVDRLIYELMGSSLYIQEDMENSRFAAFMSKTSTTPGGVTVDELQVSGRLRRFDVKGAEKYQPIREYYTKKYGTIFCEEMSKAERQRKAALLGQGGLTLQIMPDGAVIQGDTDTHASLRYIQPLRGRSAMAVGDNNTILHSIDAGLTWRKAELPISSSVTSMAFSPESGQIIFGGRKGWAGGESYQPSPNALSISQDVLDITFTNPEPGDQTSPRMIAVGREGLIQTASMQREGWMPSKILEDVQFNDIKRVGDTWYAAGDVLMQRREGETNWTKSVLPVNVRWNGLCEIPGYLVAVGDKGAIARHRLNQPDAQWEIWPSDDVPGISFDANLASSAVSDDGKTWVGVGSKGSIVVAKADESGEFGPVQRISGSYASYGVVRDILAGNAVEASLYEALKRYTGENFNDIAYHDGTFYAVGSESLLMTSRDGLSWKKEPIHVRHKQLRTIAFTGAKTGVIAGEKGLMLTTEDNGATWQTKKSQTERSIYDIAVSSDYPNGFIYAGTYGLWGFCEAVNGRCYQRSRLEPYHYYAAALDSGTQQSGRHRLMLVGEHSRVDYVSDVPGSDAVKIEAWVPGSSKVYDVAFAESDLPLLPNSARGTVNLIAAGDGSLYRSMDGGYKFQQEASGLSSAVHRLTMTTDGDTVWAFDGKGHAVEDVHGLGRWKPLKDGFIDGVLRSSGGYLIDAQCVYYQNRQMEPQKIACVEQPVQLHDITASGDKIFLGMRSGSLIQTGELSITAPAAGTIPPVAQIVPQGSAIASSENMPFSDQARVVACSGKTAVFDPSLHQLISLDNVLTDVQDVRCIQGKLTTLTARMTKNGIWTISASDGQPIWSMEVGFDPSGAKFHQSGTGRWWVAAEASESSYPLILMSNNGKSWTWRRDRITDFHAVESVGSSAVAVGDSGTVLVSEDYGVSWTQIPTKITQTLRDVCLSSDGTFGLAVGDNGTILKAEKGLSHWTKAKFNLNLDITSCTIAEQKDRFQVYFAGKGGAIYTSDKNMSKLELIASPTFEDFFDISTLETGEVIAVGGVYQDPSNICEEGFIIEADKDPKSTWFRVLVSLLLLVFWGFTIRKLVIGWKYRNE